MVTKELEHFPFSKDSLLVLYSAQEYHTENTQAFQLRGEKTKHTFFLYWSADSYSVVPMKCSNLLDFGFLKILESKNLHFLFFDNFRSQRTLVPFFLQSPSKNERFSWNNQQRTDTICTKEKGNYRGTDNWQYWRVTFKKLSTTQSRSHLLIFNPPIRSLPHSLQTQTKVWQRSSVWFQVLTEAIDWYIYRCDWYIITPLLNKDSVLRSQDSNLQLSENTAGTCFDLLRDSKDLSLGCLKSIQLFLYLVQITGHIEGLQTCYTSRHTCYRC